MFTPHPNAVSVRGIQRGKVILRITGTQSGRHRNERNVTKTLTLSPDKAREIATQLNEAAEAIKS